MMGSFICLIGFFTETNEYGKKTKKEGAPDWQLLPEETTVYARLFYLPRSVIFINNQLS